ncbi:hypothetical protein Tco_0024756, partial [Tanacetum coccineum]
DLVLIPSKSEGIFDNMCDVPFCNKNHFDAESGLMESLLNRDTLIIYSPKIDSLLEEFVGELALIALIPLGIVEADLDPKGDIYFIENLMNDNSFPRPPETLKDDSETVIDSNNDYSSSDDDSYEDIDYVDASPPDSELVSLEEVKDFDTKDGEIDTDILLTIKDDILHEKLLNINLLISKIEVLKDNPTPSTNFVLKSSSSFPNSFLEETDTSDNSLQRCNTSLLEDRSILLLHLRN